MRTPPLPNIFIKLARTLWRRSAPGRPWRDTLIAAPALLQRLAITSPYDILRAPWLATETRPRDWADWLVAARLPHPGGRRQIFDHYFVTLQAVLDGLGLGVGPIPTLEGLLTGGRLIAPFPEIDVPRAGYVALVPYDAHKTPSLHAFVEWLVSEGRDGG